VEVQDAVVRKYAETIWYQGTLSNALRALGPAEIATGHVAEARDALERAAKIDRSLADDYPVSRYNVACDLDRLARSGFRLAQPPEQIECHSELQVHIDNRGAVLMDRRVDGRQPPEEIEARAIRLLGLLGPAEVGVEDPFVGIHQGLVGAEALIAGMLAEELVEA